MPDRPNEKEKHPSKRDPYEDAADVVARSTGAQDELPADLEAAWADWSKRLQRVDEHTMTLLRAAFEAGVSASARSSAATELGRLGASKGGTARAAKLSKKRRVEIAKNAAKKRWGGDEPQRATRPPEARPGTA